MKRIDAPEPARPSAIAAVTVSPASDSAANAADGAPATPAGAPRPAIELAPSFVLPAGLAVLAVPLLAIALWAGGLVALFAAFLAFQASTIRLRFTDDALDVYRGQTRIRRFPYADWLNWAIFWPYTPILFYFKEVKSIHFLPVLFDPKTLRACLEERCPPPVKAWQ